MDHSNSQDKIKTASARELVQRQRDFFHSGQTRPLAFRMDCLQRLQASLLKHEQDFNRAVKED